VICLFGCWDFVLSVCVVRMVCGLVVLLAVGVFGGDCGCEDCAIYWAFEVDCDCGVLVAWHAMLCGG